MPTDIKSLSRDELEARFAAWHQPAYRVTQLLEWLYPHRATSWDIMTNLPRALREKLAETFSLRREAAALHVAGHRDTGHFQKGRREIDVQGHRLLDAARPDHAGPTDKTAWGSILRR